MTSPPLRMAMAMPDALLAVDAEHRLRRIGGAARDLGDVAQADHAAAGDEVDAENVLLGAEGAGDTHQDLLVAGLHHARRRDGVLALERGDQRGAVDAQPGELLVRELDVHALVLGAQDVDLGDVRQLEELLADVVHPVVQLALGEAVGREAVDDAVGVAELVVEVGADDALRQRAARCRAPSCEPGTRCPARRPAGSSPSG